jgi:hypothetical protein
LAVLPLTLGEPFKDLVADAGRNSAAVVGHRELYALASSFDAD